MITRIYFSLLLLCVSVYADASSLRSSEMRFIENKGQLLNSNAFPASDILFVAETNNMNVYLRKTGVSYVIAQADERNQSSHTNIKQPVNPFADLQNQHKEIKYHRIDMDFAGCNSSVNIIPADKAQEYFNYYLPHCKNGITNVFSYNRIIFENIYDNIDIVFYGGKSSGLKYDFVIKPGGNPNDIRLKYSGQDDLRIEDSGVRIVHSIGEFAESMPRVYQNIDGKIVDVNAGYEMLDMSIEKKNKTSHPDSYRDSHLTSPIIQFKIENYQSKYSLIIDPWITYYGGSDAEKSHCISVDKNGNSLITGETFGNAFPATVGSFQTTSGGGGWDAFVAKFDANGILLWATYYGGSDVDYGFGVVADAFDNVIVTGQTTSTDFPLLNPAQALFNNGGGVTGYGDAFVVKFNAAGVRQWATYYGGTDGETGTGIDVDAADNIVITGSTNSLDFPFTPGAFQTSSGGGVGGHGQTPSDVIVVKFSPAGVCSWATYYGGDMGDVGSSVAVDLVGDILVTGITEGNFPLSATAYQNVFGGVADAFVLKFNAAGNRSWCTYYGGNDWESGGDIDTDSGNNVIITGFTFSANFPTSAGSHQPIFGGGLNDGYVVKLNSSGNRLWSTFYGRAPYDEWMMFCTVDDNDNIFILGEWEESNLNPNISFACGYQKNFGGFEDQFIVKYNPSGLFLCNTFLGGTAEDDMDNQCGGIDYHKGFIHVTLLTYAPGYPVTAGCYQSSFGGGGGDIIIGKICGSNCGDPNTISNLDFSWSPSTVCSTYGVDFINLLSNANLCDTVELKYEWTFSSATTSSSTLRNPTGIVFPGAGLFPVKLVIVHPCGRDSITKNVNVISSPVAAASGAAGVCAGGSTVLTASGGGTYSWSTGASTSIVNVTPTGNTTYTLVVINAGCPDTTTHSVNILPSPTAVITGDTIVCVGDSLTLTAGTGIGYLWNTTATSPVITVIPGGNTSYSVIVSNATFCKDTATINITANPLPLVSIGAGNSSICQGDSALLTAAGGNTYQWSNGSSASAIIVFPTLNTVYTLTASSIDGCLKDTSITIVVNQIPLANAGLDDTICVGDPAILNASGGASYSWNNGQLTAVINVSPAVTTSYTVTVSNGNCNDIDSARVVVYNNPVANAGSNVSILQGQTTTLSGSGGGLYDWKPVAGISCPTCSNPLVSPTITTTYYLIVTDANGCTSTDSVIVTVEIICNDLFIPNVFSPNTDGANDVFYVYGNCIKTMYLVIYDRWGEKVFESNNQSKGWDGTYKGKEMNAAVFTYIFNAELIFGDAIEKKGNITLIK